MLRYATLLFTALCALEACAPDVTPTTGSSTTAAPGATVTQGEVELKIQPSLVWTSAGSSSTTGQSASTTDATELRTDQIELALYRALATNKIDALVDSVEQSFTDLEGDIPIESSCGSGSGYGENNGFVDTECPADSPISFDGTITIKLKTGIAEDDMKQLLEDVVDEMKSKQYAKVDGTPSYSTK